MTDPRGPCFVSYRRTRAADAGLLVQMLRERGIPTWQDVADLATTPTEAELRRILGDSQLSSAILLVTPEVENSTIIREVEAPAILERHLKADGFFAVPVAGGGLDYTDVPRVLGPKLGQAYIPGWNIHRSREPFRAAEAATVADLVLKQRVNAIQKAAADGPLQIVAASRAPVSNVPEAALRIDVRHLFDGRVATAENWTTRIVPGLHSVVRAIQSCPPQRDIEISGLVAIPLAIALGTAFLSLAGVRARWVQDQASFGRPPEVWGLDGLREASGFHAEVHARDSAATDIAVLVSVAADVVGDFNTVCGSLPALRATVTIKPEKPSAGGRTILSAAQALDVAHVTIDAIRNARTMYVVTGQIHLFMAVPVGLAFMIGQLLNTTGVVQTYEHIPGSAPAYQPAALLTPSI